MWDHSKHLIIISSKDAVQLVGTNRLFYKSVPEDNHSNTQYFKQEYK